VVVTALHEASFDELAPRTAYLLWQLRARVFVLEQECPYLDLDGRDLEPATRHLWAEQDGTPVAYLRLLDDEAAWRIGRVLVAPEHRGRGLARDLMAAALARVGDRPCRLDAQSYLVGWYGDQGFEPCGEVFLEDGIPHMPMCRPGQSSRSLP